MKNLFYARINGELKESGLAGRLRVRRIMALAGFTGLLAALWWFGRLGPEVLLGLLVFGTIWSGDKGPGAGGPGSDEPLPPWWWAMLEELMKILGPRPEPEGLPPFHLSELPPLELETKRWPTRVTRPMDTEQVLKTLEREIARSFDEEIRRRFGEPKKAGGEYLSSLLRPAREPTFTERLEQLARQPEPREPTFSERLEQLARQPEPREPTFSERLEQLARQDAEKSPDFRTLGERRQDERRRAERRRPSKKEPSAIEKLLAQVEAERRRKAAQFPETDPQTAEELDKAEAISREELHRRLTPRQLMKEEVYRRFGSFLNDMVKHPPKSVEEAGKLFEKHFKDLGIQGQLEGHKLVYRDSQGEIAAEFHFETASGIYSFDLDGDVSMVFPPQAGAGIVGRILPPTNERATVVIGSRNWGVGQIIPQDLREDSGLYVAFGPYYSPISATISFPTESDDTLVELQQLLGGLF